MKMKKAEFRKKLICILLCLGLLGGGFGGTGIPSAKAAKTQPDLKMESVTDISEYDTNEVLVVYEKPSGQGGFQKSSGSVLPKGSVIREVSRKAALIETDSRSDLEETIRVLSREDGVAYVQPNYKYYLNALTADAYSDYQWAYTGDYNIGIQEAWAKGSGDNAPVTVAVMDSGIDYKHADLKDSMWINEKEASANGKDDDKNGYIDDKYGWNFVLNNEQICQYRTYMNEYADNHGTHVAGIIAATADNGIGIAGVASKSNVSIMSLKVFSDNEAESASTADIVKAIQYAEDNGASICNMSFGGDSGSEDTLLYNTMKKSELLFICAAGNGLSQTRYKGFDITLRPQAPASYDLYNIITVGNMNPTGSLDESSCYSAADVDIAAPGTEIVSTVVDGSSSAEGTYAIYTGTSMACPMVSGAAALVASYYGGNLRLTAAQIKEAILGGAAANSLLEGKVASNRQLNAGGAVSYYENRILASTAVKSTKTTNDKKVVVSVDSRNALLKSIKYVKGNQGTEYFAEEAAGESLTEKNGQASFWVKESGTYTIYIENEAGEKTVQTVKVTVPKLKSIKLSASAKSLKKGKTYTLKTTVNPSSLTYKKITYKSGNSKVAAVNAKGKITAKRLGTAVITVKVSDGRTTKTARCKITVKA